MSRWRASVPEVVEEPAEESIRRRRLLSRAKEECAPQRYRHLPQQLDVPFVARKWVSSICAATEYSRLPKSYSASMPSRAATVTTAGTFSHGRYGLASPIRSISGLPKSPAASSMCLLSIGSIPILPALTQSTVPLVLEGRPGGGPRARAPAPHGSTDAGYLRDASHWPRRRPYRALRRRPGS